METGTIVIIWLLSVVSLASIAMAIFCARLTFLLAKEVSARDLSLIESALRFHKANSLEEVIRANVLDKNLNSNELPSAPSAPTGFQERLIKSGEAKDEEGHRWRLE